ncbi:hypothetical protein [Paraburkholderia translucens]|uniref:hypothetical protein n=1 Tax=Paraburkholderia translucens TaxID=2886945 RepID=UPI001E5E60D7|nr:hypothetical protein [Paraburkholderia sp. MMS20-SJTN17]
MLRFTAQFLRRTANLCTDIAQQITGNDAQKPGPLPQFIEALTRIAGVLRLRFSTHFRRT